MDVALVAIGAVTPATLWTSWRPDLGIVVALMGISVVYARAVHLLWASAGHRVGISGRQATMFGLGVIVLAVALVSPLDTVATALFSAHMVQHLLLALVAAPLLVAGRLHVAVMPLWPIRWRRWWAGTVMVQLRRHAPLGIVLAVLLHVAVVVAWHLPSLYDLAVRSDPVHALEHLTMVAAALPFWVAMGTARRTPGGTAALGAFVVTLSFTLLAAAMTISARPWYDSHLATTLPWGLTPLQDQQLAAAIMWVPGGMVYLAAAMAAVVRWLDDDEHRQAPRLEHV